MPELEKAMVARIEVLLGDKIVGAHPAEGGYSSAQRWVVKGLGGRTAFAKIGATPISVKGLRQEASVYRRLTLPCMPEVYGWDGDPDPPLLLLADLSKHTWPPPWTNESVDRVLDVIDSVHTAEAPLPHYEELHDTSEDWWARIAADPEAFLRLNLVRSDWFDRNLEQLAASARDVSGAGSAVIHFDLRSDNLCLSLAQTYVVDWSMACLGNPSLDLALFLPGLAGEGGPQPEVILPDRPAMASWVAGCFAWYASKPHLPKAPGVRAMQRRHLEFSLPWAIRELDLEPL